jgi:hypothetical protein
MRAFFTATLLSALSALPAASRAADPTPQLLPAPADAEPAVRLAGLAARTVERDETNWRELTDRLVKAVETYKPDLSVDPLPEEEALQALRRYCGKLLESGKEVASLHAKWADARVALEDSLRKTPPYYRAAAKAMRERAGLARFPVIREKYQLAADVWEQLAIRAETRAKQSGTDEAGGVAALVAEENQFLEDFLKTLDALPRPSGAERGHADELLTALRKHAARGDEMHKQLLAFRDKLKAAPQPTEATAPTK